VPSRLAALEVRSRVHSPVVQAVYYRDAARHEPVNEFIDALAPERREQLDHTISPLNRLGPNDPPLPFPYSSQVDGQLCELRCHFGRDPYRIRYRRSLRLVRPPPHHREALRQGAPRGHRDRTGPLGGLPGTYGRLHRRPPRDIGRYAR
jgi:hypothetical protein